ncbi:hypothetical protein Vretimale_6760 [Volvox reticuliferus]|uniref:Serine/threonine-protein kinase RIO1 n=1 Tax=Volvox reticuliferus TaxID=1737510 RepID=A0A8J4G8B1_9CHLO|nr:hypothetical protein Vretifemale_7121 [Volvox reticuliferus]GIM02004.1 hypothetical protein Vretimale_6760 [Volvox reticuliferus]
MAATLPDEIPFLLLQSRYADDDDDVHATNDHQPDVSPPLAKSVGAQELGTAADLAAHIVDDDIDEDENDDDNDVVGEDEEEAGSEELAEALEWADMRDDLMNRGNSRLGFTSGLLRRPNAAGGAANRQATLQPRAANRQRLDSHFHGGRLAAGGSSTAAVLDDPLDAFDGVSARVPTSVANVVRTTALRESAARIVSKDKSDRATVEQAIDPRTRMVLFKMLNRGLFSEINGCVSTGKEANVYHASGGDGRDLAIKIYKTSILVFKDRDRYVSGDFRFRNGYCKSNPRKMVKMWAEKEMRNLMRLRAAGINSPQPLQLRLHVLVMEFIGEDGVAAPRLRDAGLPLQRLRSAYTEMLLVLRNLYQKCRLVHADLSEYNILYHKGELYIIDVSQAVDLDHPKALDFLREDCKHVNDYFRRAGVATLTVRETFEFVVDPAINGENVDAALERLSELAASRPIDVVPEEEVAAAVFHQAYIPRRLEEVVNFERDHERLQRGGKETEGIYYTTITGMKHDGSGARLLPAVLETEAKTSTAALSDAMKPREAQSRSEVLRESSMLQKHHGKVTVSAPSCSTVDTSMEGKEVVVVVSTESHPRQMASPAAGGKAEVITAPGGSVNAGSGLVAVDEVEVREVAEAGRANRGIQQECEEGEEDEESDEEEDSGTDDDEGDGRGGGGGDGGSVAERDKDAERAARKAHKKAVKEANREKRKSKVPKHVKKAKTKGGKRK